MQHAEHFLSRLDRLPRSEVDLALELYRDPELLQAVLDAATLPERAERVAISIDDPVQGPFLIVTRTGHFVTCLGRGMRAGEHPIITRGQLDSISRSVDRLRERMALATQLGAERGHARLFRPILDMPAFVSREAFLAVAAWEPLLGATFLDLYMVMARELLVQGPILRTRGAGERKTRRRSTATGTSCMPPGTWRCSARSRRTASITRRSVSSTGDRERPSAGRLPGRA